MLPRLHRLLGADGRALTVAVDHGQFREPSWLPPIRDAAAVIAALAASGPDGLTLSAGHAHLLQSVPGSRRPALILRADHTTAYTAARTGPARALLLDGVVERALRLDAAAVVCGILDAPGEPDLYDDCLRNLVRLRAATERYGVPLIGEIIAMTARDGVPGVSEDVTTIATLARQAAELGVDVVKVDPPARDADLADVVVAAAGRPVFVSGGSPRAEELAAEGADAATIRRSARLLAAGAAGLSYGRPVLYASRPPALTAVLAQLVHGALTADEAVAHVEGVGAA